MQTEPVDVPTAMARRQRLREVIAKMADAIADGEEAPSRPELRELAGLCEDYFLPVEAARVRRWAGDV